jgi:hypothetical protein
MPFAYYARLSRAQQKVYDQSDRITEIRLAEPAALHPLVADLDRSLRSEDRAATERATARLIRSLCEAMGLPPVAVQVLAARPHARWGELHGLYTTERGRPPKIQLWMRTARRKRVVAFRTYLRTLLHEVGHHVDYAGLRLRDSFHTEGFYKRESSLFHQLVPEADGDPQTFEDFRRLSRPARLRRLARATDRLARAIEGQPASVLARRPQAGRRAAVEVLAHLRDDEELVFGRLEQIMLMNEPRFPRTDPDRWAADRQYLRHDAAVALAHFRRRREETLAFLKRLAPEDWTRAGVPPDGGGRRTIDDLVAEMAWHDASHLEQVRGALRGRP